MIFIHKKSATAVRTPTLAFMILGPWALLAVPAWLIGQPIAPKLHGYFALAIAAVVIGGTKIVRREPGLIVVRSLWGIKTVNERHARLGVIPRGGGKYWATELELMPTSEFAVGAVPNKALHIETFSSTATDKPMHVARRVARTLT
ncbi:MAG: hypothetical protein JWM82_1870, partial [Myxococcales bacterium]|nr:hypothetical protein [Myxococcales bacterium]